MTNSRHPDTPRLQQPASPVTPPDVWPVPLRPTVAHINGTAMPGADQHGRPVTLIRLEVYTDTAAVIVHMDPHDAITAFGKILHLARAARTGLHLPPT